MFSGTIRIWMDELERIPEYSSSYPTGVCPGKTWKRRSEGSEDCPFIIGQYVLMKSGSAIVRKCWFRVKLLQGPRLGNDTLRFKIRCTKEDFI